MMLQVRSLTKSFNPHTAAVVGVSFDVAAGEIICLLGPSGCGKTTLLRMIAGLEKPDAGDVLLGRQSLTAVPPHQRDFGMMFQDFALFPHKNVFDNVAFGLQMRGDSAAQVQTRVAEMLELVDLRGLERRDISQLSGGEQQRVALARSLAPGPQLLMLDEPLGALDRALRDRLMLDLRTILKQVGVTAIYVTHDQTEAFAIADRVAVMNAGRIEQLGRPQVVFKRPASPFVARFLGFHNLLPGTVRPSGAVTTEIGDLSLTTSPAKPRETVTVLIRPEAAYPTPNSPASSALFQFRATITAISFRGKYYQVWVAAAGKGLMFEMPSVAGWEVGDEVALWLDLEKVLIW